jgi:hypothetical protein
MMRENFSTGSVPFRKAYLQSLIESIEVDDGQGCHGMWLQVLRISLREASISIRRLLCAHAHQHSRGAGTGRRLAQLMRNLGWMPVKVRDLTRGL